MASPARFISSLIFVSCVLAGCGQTILIKRVASASTDPPRGVPFYVKTAACKHQTVWLQPIYTLTLKVSFPQDKGSSASNEKPEPLSSTRTVVLTLHEHQSKEVSELYKAVNSGKVSSDLPVDEIKDLEDKWSAVQELAPSDPYRLNEDELGTVSGTDKNRVVEVANEVVTETFVDYRTMYFYNTSKPWVGSSQASIKLASDGTMTEGSGQQESKTLQAFLDLLPVKEVLSGTAKGVLPLAGFVPIKGTAKYELSADVKVSKHTHYLLTTELPPCSPPTDEVPKSGEKYNLTVEDASEAKKNSQKENEIAISGSIQLPKKAQADQSQNQNQKKN